MNDLLKKIISRFAGRETGTKTAARIATGLSAAVGAGLALIALALTAWGNPANMGFCTACFVRDIAGALGLHASPLVQYLRPEVIGIALGAFALALLRREYRPKGGSSLVTRFVLGFAMMMGALIFLGCPLRMFLRIAGGDLNAIVGLFGFVAGIALGAFFLKSGFSLRRNYEQQAAEGVHLPFGMLLLLGILVFVPSLLFFSVEGPGSMHAPVLASLVAGLAVGATAFVTRLCFAGGIRDLFLLKKFNPMIGAIIALVATGIIGNLLMGTFNLGFEGQPVAHTEGMWNFLGLALLGLCSVLLAGCPLRQLVLAGSGNSDSVVTVLGMLGGAAMMHNWQMTATPTGVSLNGQVGFAVAAVLVLAIAIYYTFFKKSAALYAESGAEKGKHCE